MTDKIMSLQAVFKRKGGRLSSLLPAIDVREKIGSVGGAPTDGYISLYAWANGQREDECCSNETPAMYRGFFFVPIDVSISRGRDFGIINDRQCLLPIFDNYAGECYFIDLGGGDTRGRVGYVNLRSDSEDTFTWRYDSLNALLDDVINQTEED